MSDIVHYFSGASRRCAVALPFNLSEMLDQWAALRIEMMRGCPSPFSRDEWAYLMTFLDPEQLRRPFVECFGPFDAASSGSADTLLRSRGAVAIWLPNNVSLLGPLMLVLVSLSGDPLRLKAASQAQDLAGAFLDYAREHVPSGPLATYLRESVRHERFDREDPENVEFSRDAAVRIVFGSNDAAVAVDALPHRADGLFFAFTDRRSEAWVQVACLSDAILKDLIRVFAVYGQAGCTSPRRVVLLEGSLTQARRLRDDLIRLWPQLIRRDPPMHVASDCIMAGQLAAATGWEPCLAPQHAAVIAAGTLDLPENEGLMTLPIVPASLEQALALLPTNIQTIGHALVEPDDPGWLRHIAATPVKRFVPLARMHHMGPVWDGHGFWRQLFEEISLH